MVVKADVRVQHNGCLMTSLQPGTVAMQVSADEECDLVLVQGDSAEVERVVRHIQADDLQPFDVMGRTPTSALVRTRNPPVGVIPTILAAGCTILWPAVYRDGWEHYALLAPSDARLRTLVRRLARFGTTVLEAASEVPAESVGATVPVADLGAQGFALWDSESVNRTLSTGVGTWTVSPESWVADVMGTTQGIATFEYARYGLPSGIVHWPGETFGPVDGKGDGIGPGDRLPELPSRPPLPPLP